MAGSGRESRGTSPAESETSGPGLPPPQRADRRDDADPFELSRFLAAQEGVVDRAESELRAGHKRGHWMWFVFPQLRGLGGSPTAQRYGVASLAEARAYLAHPVLGPRLVRCAEAVLAAPGSAHDILGSPDDLKLRSCMTLFAEAAPGQAVFVRVLQRFYDGRPDPLTRGMLGDLAPGS